MVELMMVLTVFVVCSILSFVGFLIILTAGAAISYALED